MNEGEVILTPIAQAKGISLAFLEKPELRILRATEAIDTLPSQPISDRASRFVGYPVQGRQVAEVHHFLQRELARVKRAV